MVFSASETLRSVPVVIVVPGTTNLSASRFPHTVQVEPSNSNGLIQASVFLGFQLQAVDPKIIEPRRLGELTEEELTRLEDAVLGALGFDPPA